jgi:hypothetical protein
MTTYNVHKSKQSLCACGTQGRMAIWRSALTGLGDVEDTP